jgi:hypothetical protein
MDPKGNSLYDKVHDESTLPEEEIIQFMNERRY